MLKRRMLESSMGARGVAVLKEKMEYRTSECRPGKLGNKVAYR
jgi:hypothetical protein